jgi:hypothetical protein
VVAREWLNKTSAKRAAVTQEKVQSWLERDIFPEIGAMPISAVMICCGKIRQKVM